MTILITGGSKCGKSRYAEKILSRFCGRRFYIATMQPFGEDAYTAIERHRRMREGKGFETIERYTDIGGLLLPEGCGVLLECVGNLCANEMFSGSGIIHPAEKIVKGTQLLSHTAGILVIVTNQVGCDGIRYPSGTENYIAELGEINRRIAGSADCVVECVYGIPVAVKGVLPC